MNWQGAVGIGLMFGVTIAALAFKDKDDYQLFDQGTVIHHRSDGHPAVVLHCDRYKCRVKTSGSDIMENLWMVYEIKETPNEEKTDG